MLPFLAFCPFWIKCIMLFTGVFHFSPLRLQLEVGRITSTAPGYLTVGVKRVHNTWNEMENICRKSGRHAMGIVLSLLCSEGQIAVQRSNTEPPALPALGLMVETLATTLRHQPYTCYGKLKGQNPHEIQLSRSFSCKLMLCPPKTDARCLCKERCAVTKLRYRNELPDACVLGKQPRQRATEKQTESREVWKRNSNTI